MDRKFLRRSGLFVLALGTALFLSSPRLALANEFDAGVEAYAAGRYQEAADIWLPLAQAEDPYAQHALGKLYESGGPGFPSNASLAAHWYEAAAKQGLAAAQNNLALLYSDGRGIPQDRAKAIELWRLAAEQGHLHAQYNLALAYYLGEGVELNDRQAAYWFARAADGGLADAQFAVGQMHRMGIGLVKNEAVALGWYEKAALQGHSEAAHKAAELNSLGVQAVAPLPLPEPGGEIGGTASTEPSVTPAPAEDQTAEAIPPTPPTGIAVSPEPEKILEQGDGEGAGSELADDSTVLPDEVPEVTSEVAEAPVAVTPEVLTGDALEPIQEAASDLPPSPPSGGLANLPEPTSILPVAMTTEAEAPAELETATLVETTPVNDAAMVAIPATASSLQVASSGDSVMWFGTASKAAEAESMAADLKSRFPDLLAAVTLSIKQANVGGKTVFRVTVGPFVGREAARAACDTMKARDAQLFCKAAASG